MSLKISQMMIIDGVPSISLSLYFFKDILQLMTKTVNYLKLMETLVLLIVLVFSNYISPMVKTNKNLTIIFKSITHWKWIN